MKKDALKENIEHDVNKIRGALLEIISNNRALNVDLVDQMGTSDYSLLEEYNLLTKSILDAAKILTDVNQTTPKIIKDISNVQDEKKSIDLNDLIDES